MIKCRVHYVSPKGCAEMVAESIARVAKVPKEALLPAYLPVGVALMFLGCEGGKADKITLEFANSLNTNRVAHAALFCCNPKKSDAPIQQMKAALEAQGIKVLEQTFVTTAKGFFGGKNPSEADLKAAAEWAAACEKIVMGE